MTHKTSIIIPARNEVFLAKTVADIYAKATGEIEVIVVLDGYWPNPPLPERSTLSQVHHTESRGMRASINTGAALATGKYLLKCDAHVMFEHSFDETLKADCEDDWIVVPRRYALDADNWVLRSDRSAVDYHYLTYPFEKPDHIGLHGKPWKERAKERASITVDDEMSSQGSCWFMQKAYFERFDGMQEDGYGSFTQEFQQLGMRTWLSGGRVVVNKKTWYAHLWKKHRGYSLPSGEQQRGALFSADYWVNNRWAQRTHDFQWLIEKFSPVPGWFQTDVLPGDKESLAMLAPSQRQEVAA